MLQRIGVYPSSMARFTPWASGIKAILRVPLSTNAQTSVSNVRFLSSSPNKTEVADDVAEDCDNKEPGVQFQPETPKVVKSQNNYINKVKLTKAITQTKGIIANTESMSAIKSADGKLSMEEIMKPVDVKTGLLQTMAQFTTSPSRSSVSDTLSLNPLMLLKELQTNAQAVAMLDGLSSSELITVLLACCRTGSRPTPIVKQIFGMLKASEREFSSKECSAVLFSMSKLYFPDCELAAKVCTSLINYVSLLQPHELNGITRSLGRLHYRNDELLSRICKRYESNMDDVNSSDFIDLLSTMSYLDYRPENKDLYLKVVTRLQDIVSMPTWFDLIHSLVVLDWATPELIQRNLKEDVVQRFVTDNSALVNRVRLVNSYAQIKYTNYNGGKHKGFVFPLSSQIQTGLQKVFKVLSNFGSTECIIVNDLSPHGLPIHATFLLDKNARIIPVVKPHESTINRARVALSVWQYRDLVLPECEQPIGPKRCVEQLLKLEGYHIVRVPYSFASSSPVEQTIFFEKTLQEISSQLKA